MNYYGVTLSDSYLSHHGVKGQKWGVRRYQYEDGTRTPLGKRHERGNDDYITRRQDKKVSQFVDRKLKSLPYKMYGKEKVDTYLKEGTEFGRVQSSEIFEKFPFYATYIKRDKDMYLGLFGDNLIRRANAVARQAEKTANKTGNEMDVENAKSLREKSDNIKIYQLGINASKKIKIPSDENASDITYSLLKDKSFKEDLLQSLENSKKGMKRPAQQEIFKQAIDTINSNKNITEKEKFNVYKALNLALVSHNDYDIRVQDKFYGELKKKGYSAILDYNDKVYSSYKAKRPVIVFDHDSVALQSVTETSPKVVNSLYKKYNTERMIREIPNTAISYVTSKFDTGFDKCSNYVARKTEDYITS